MVALLAVAAAAAWRQRRSATTSPVAPSPGEPQFVPFTPSAAPTSEPAAPAPPAKQPVAKQPLAKKSPVKQPAAKVPAKKQPAWVAPADGECPAGYPVKAVQSGLFHVPGGRFYARTTPERCYADAAAAIADGYRQSKA